MTGRAGYSLFEVLIAFVIMSLVLAVLIPGQARLLGRAVAQEEQLLAHDYALSRLATLGIDGQAELGTTRDTYRDWQITTAITQGEMIRTETATRAVAVTVIDAQGRHLAIAETLMVAP